MWRVGVLRRHDRPDGSRLIERVARAYCVATSARQAEARVRRRTGWTNRRGEDRGNGEVVWTDCECERVRWMDELPGMDEGDANEA